MNEPYRPIPSGAISESEVTFQAWFLFLSAMVLSFELDQWAGNDWPVIFATSVKSTLSTLSKSSCYPRGLWYRWLYFQFTERAARRSVVFSAARMPFAFAHSQRPPDLDLFILFFLFFFLFFKNKCLYSKTPQGVRVVHSLHLLGASAQAQGQRLDGDLRPGRFLHCLAVVVRPRHVRCVLTVRPRSCAHGMRKRRRVHTPARL